MTATPPPAESAPAPDLSGKVLGDFKVLRRLGEGGMGQVYLAEQISLKRKVALKVLRADLAANEVSLKRFRAEAEAVARITHANIVQVYAIDDRNGMHFMALEYVDGTNLRDYLAKKGVPELPIALSVIRQVASALARAHELGIVHRDIKPENILITRHLEVKVTDFGLSRCFKGEQPALNLTASGITMGTPLYMSPEQVQGHNIDPRSDIYSFGVTCFHMLTGDPPFRGQTAFEVAVQHVQKEPEKLLQLRPDLPVELCDLIDKMMAKDPNKRFQTARDILRDLTQLRSTLSNTRPLPPVTDESVEFTSSASNPALLAVTEPVAAPKKRRWKLWAVPLSMLLALVAGAALAYQFTTPPEPVPEAAPKDIRIAFRNDEEDRLKDDVAKLTTGKRPRREGAQAAIDLGLYYLEQRRWNDAESFFKALVDDPRYGGNYEELGWLGQGIVLAYQDKPRESLLALERSRVGLERENFRKLQLFNNPRLRLFLARALDRDRVNCDALKIPFPADLEQLRRPQPIKGKAK
ncbi:MAG: serine/threonine protein kinase [Gemmataceae bacterium]